MASKKAKSSVAARAAAAARPQAGASSARAGAASAREPASAQDGGEVERIRALARAMSEGELSELEIEDTRNGVRVRLRRGPEPSAAAPMHVVTSVPHAYAPPPAAAGAAPIAAAPAAAAPAAAATPAPAAARQDAVPFTSPMVGTFYRSPSPDAEPFVEVGSRFGEDTTICIIEAMKVMNEIKAELRGSIVEVLVQNGEPVEFGQPLFLIKRA